MIKRIFYMNDEQRGMPVRIRDDRYDGSTGIGDIWTNLAPAEGRIFEVHVPAAHIIYVKKWRDLVMISSIDPAVLPQSGGSLPGQDDA
jgi:hypothetical protein